MQSSCKRASSKELASIATVTLIEIQACARKPNSFYSSTNALPSHCAYKQDEHDFQIWEHFSFRVQYEQSCIYPTNQHVITYQFDCSRWTTQPHAHGPESAPFSTRSRPVHGIRNFHTHLRWNLEVTSRERTPLGRACVSAARTIVNRLSTLSHTHIIHMHVLG